MAINVQTKSFWEGYVRNLQTDANQFLRQHSGAQRSRPAARSRGSSTYVDKSWNWNTYNTTYHYGGSSSSRSSRASSRRRDDEKEKSNEGTALAAMVVGLIVMVAGAFFTARFSRQEEEQVVAIGYSTEIQRALNRPEWEGEPPKVIGNLRQLLTHRINIESIDVRRTHHYVLNALAYLFSGVTLFIGGYTAAAGMMSAGFIGLVVSTVFLAISMGYHWNDDSRKARIYRMIAGEEGLAQRILNTLARCNAALQIPAASTSRAEHCRPPGAFRYAEFPKG